MPPIRVNDKAESFRRVKVVYSAEPIRDIEDAYKRLDDNPDHSSANAFIALDLLRAAEEGHSEEYAQKSIAHLDNAIVSGKANEYLYTLYHNTKKLSR
jgi:phage-related protein